jgi:BirA family transcriptional regulator, biotin operon repressor / biotin---[acetyl-CoA-carboxylase] ligase
MTLLPPSLPTAYRLVSRESVGSTNDEARRLARQGAVAGTVVWALEQTAGRGRRGRYWSSPRGNLFVSLILRPACSAEQAAQLGFVAALGVGDALAQLAPGLDAPLYKWPNDVLIRGRKIAGILLESEMGPRENPALLIVGIGVNLASAPSDADFPATSIADEGWAAPEPEMALEAVLGHFEIWTRRWQQQGFDPVREAWRARAFALGEQIRARLQTAVLFGRFVDIDHQGALLLETAGKLRRIPAGDVYLAV